MIHHKEKLHPADLCLHQHTVSDATAFNNTLLYLQQLLCEKTRQCSLQRLICVALINSCSENTPLTK